MNSWLLGAYALILGIISFFTGEIVTFVMLGFILLTLHNINASLKKLAEANNYKKTDLTEKINQSID